MDEIKFFDTCALLSEQREIFSSSEMFYISSITINELESIKTSGTKDEEIKYKARTLLSLLNENEDKYKIVLYHNSFFDEMEKFDLEKSPDNKIISCAYQLHLKGEPILFITEDKACREVASSIGLKVLRPNFKDDKDYLGFKEFFFDDNSLAEFYADFNKEVAANTYNLIDNEYLVVNYQDKKYLYKWLNGQYITVPYMEFKSDTFGKITPYENDIYQQMAMDSLKSNQVTLLGGPAGSGKTMISFAYMFSLLEKGKIDKIIIFCNTVATKGSARLGFYPGSRTEKLLDSQIGNLLCSKLGDRIAVERLIDEGLLVLLPMSDIRGYDTTGMNAAIYITEAQNMDIELMKLALQRIGEDSICILDGDYNTQVDLSSYAGRNNGMRRVSEVFRGSDLYGEVQLQNIYRSKIAELAQQM